MTITNPGASDYWNGGGGQRWVDKEQQYDRMLAPITAPLLAAAELSPGHRVIDIGCGFGPTTEAAADGVAPDGDVLGVDLSVPLVDRARARSAERRAAGSPAPRYVVADAQATDLADLAGWPLDRIISRFGVMFFDDPPAAFANIARAVAPGGRLVMAVWQGIEHNPWMAVGGAAIAAGHGVPFAGPGEGPGPYALADAGRVETLLRGAGFASVVVDDFRTSLRLAGGVGAAEAAEHIVDAVTMFLPPDVDPAPWPDRVAWVTEALAPYDEADGVALGAAMWIVTARP